MCRLAYEHYDPLIASIIVMDSLKFVNANVLEGREEFKRILPSHGGMGQNWPWYLRDMDGVAEAYAYLIWPKAKYPDVSCYMESKSCQLSALHPGKSLTKLSNQ